MPVYLSVYLPFCQSVYLPVCLSVYLLECLSISQTVNLFVCLPARLSYPSVCPIRPPVRPTSVCPSTHPSIYPSAWLSVCLTRPAFCLSFCPASYQSVRLSFYQSVRPSFCLSISPSVYPSELTWMRLQNRSTLSGLWTN